MATVAKNEILSSLAVMGYDEKYIARAVKIHSKSKFGTNYNLSLLVEIIDRLKQKDALKNNKKKRIGDDQGGAFCAHFGSADELLEYLNYSNLIDYRFDNGRYVLCRIIEKDLFNEYKILLHPASQPLGMTKHNKYCYIYQEYMHLAIAKSITLRKVSRASHALYSIGVDAPIDINPLHKQGHQGWKHGQIIKLDDDSAQAKVSYYLKNKNHCYWIHLENAEEAAPFNTKYNPLKHDMMAAFAEYSGDDNALKRFTSIDVIENTAAQMSKVDIMDGLMHFGYTKALIIAAMEQSKDDGDMNQIVENIERIRAQNKAQADKKNEDLHNNLSSMMVGNDLMMDDIIDQMECGDDGNNDEALTPMGHTPNGLPPPPPPEQFGGYDDAPVAFGHNNEYNVNAAVNHNPLLIDAPEGNGAVQKLNMKNNEKKENRKRSQSKAKKLWKSGKKALKKKKKKGGKENKKANAIFGVAPHDLACSHSDAYVSPIPNVLNVLRHHLFVNNGHLIEGIFRIAPNGDECRAIEDALNDGALNSIEFVNVAAHIIANLIKLWFRQLPDPIVQDIVAPIEKCNSTQQVDVIMRNELCEPKSTYFVWLLDLCCDVVHHSTTNKMGINAISVVIAPNLYDPAKIQNAKLMSFSADIIRFLQFAIEWRQMQRQYR